jgi:cytidine deaminase
MPRYRIAADVVTKDDQALTGHQMQQVARTLGTLANTAAMHEIDGVDANLRIDPVIVYVHQHESTEDYMCQDCRSMARDGVNSTTQR